MSNTTTQPKQNQHKIVPTNDFNLHVYLWICKSGYVDIDAIIEIAQNEGTEEKAKYDGDILDGESCLERLEEIIRIMAELEWWNDWIDVLDVSDYPMFQYGNYSLYECPCDLRDLFVPLLAYVWEREVSYYEIAKLILIDKGLWEYESVGQPVVI